MLDTIDLSIIVPIFNTRGEMLLRCFESLRTYSAMQYEVLIVDDGSQKATGDFCKAYVQNHPSFRYMYKPNGGVSSARNYGLDAARGRYILFVDSDDELLFSEDLIDILQESYDVIFFDFVETMNGVSYRRASFNGKSRAISYGECCERIISTSNLNSVWAKIYNREFIKKHRIRFDETMISGEDLLFIMDVTRMNGSYFYASVPIYHYFLDLQTYKNRNIRFPKQIISNAQQINRYKRTMVENSYTMPIKAELLEQIEATEIETIFNCSADVCMARKLTKEIKEELSKWGCRKYCEYHRLTKAGIKLRIIAYRQWLLLQVVAKIREVYLRIN